MPPAPGREAGRANGARSARDLAVVVLAKVAVSALVLAAGFRAVSDDDFSRVVLAQAWAHAPRLDPTGSSWLPVPFWLNGALFRVFGPTLDVARAIAFVLGAVSAALVYVAALWITGDRRAAVPGALLAAVFPWSACLGVATVPELPAAALDQRIGGERRTVDDEREIGSRDSRLRQDHRRAFQHRAFRRVMRRQHLGGE